MTTIYLKCGGRLSKCRAKSAVYRAVQAKRQWDYAEVVNLFLRFCEKDLITAFTISAYIGSNVTFLGYVHSQKRSLFYNLQLIHSELATLLKEGFSACVLHSTGIVFK